MRMDFAIKCAVTEQLSMREKLGVLDAYDHDVKTNNGPSKGIILTTPAERYVYVLCYCLSIRKYCTAYIDTGCLQQHQQLLLFQST